MNQVEMTRGGAIVVDAYGKTSDPNIYAAGDAAIAWHNVLNRVSYIPLASSAVRQGQIVGLNIAGIQYHSRGEQGATAVSIGDYTFAAVGLTELTAKLEGVPAIGVTYEAPYRSSFVTPNPEVLVKLVFHKDTHQLLGGQLYSQMAAVVQAADTLSLAIQNKNTLEDLAYTDMLYHPLYNQVQNYLNLAAIKALDQVGFFPDNH